MSDFTRLAQQAYEEHYNQPSTKQWSLKETMHAIMPFLEANGGKLDAMPGLRQAFKLADAQEMQAMWAEYCHLGDLLYTLEQDIDR
jgi:hypothetical protein